MAALTPRTAAVLDLMDLDLPYSARDLQALAPALGVDAVREIMHELWLAREVERVGDTAWRRVRKIDESRPDPAALRVGHVKPEDLFDHAAFEEWFK